jgi:ATP-dependent helicase HrpB
LQARLAAPRLFCDKPRRAVQTLPIDPLLPQVTEKFLTERMLVLEAAPGAGKTTRVPPALADALPGEIVVTEPRRLAARMAATRVASERGSKLGDVIGYTVRFEDVSSRRTRVRYVTEGILLRRLLKDPELEGVSAVVLDEFHERHLETDLLLTLLFRLKRTVRPDLGLLVMSATLEAGPVAAYLGDCPRFSSEGRLFPIQIEHLPAADDRPLEKQVVSAVRRAVTETPAGDVLVFLPGAAEIRRASEALQPLATERRLLVLPLHGDLSVREQTRAVEPAPERKVVLATNVAESSVTIDGVSVVVDSGLARIAGHSEWSGMPTLEVEKVSRASAIQRAGRAGRTREGRVLRLYTRGDFDTRPEHTAPEITRADLSEALLLLHGAGVTNGAELSWLTPPKTAAVASGEALLRELGAVADSGALTAIGRRLLELPLHPRLARLLVEGERRGVAGDAALLAALLSERDIRVEARTQFSDRGGARELGAGGPSDVLELADRFDEAHAANFDPHRLRAAKLDPQRVSSVARASDRLRAVTRSEAPAPESAEKAERALLACVLAGFPDRLARRRKRGERELVLRSGRTARLSERSVVHDAALMVAVDAEERPGRPSEVRLASAVDDELLLELFGDQLELTDELEWNASSERVESVSSLRWGAVVLEENRVPAPASPEASALLAARAKERPDRFLKSDAAGTLAVRLALVGAHRPKLGLPAEPGDLLAQTLANACEGATSFAELESAPLETLVLLALSPEQKSALGTLAPEHVVLPGGRRTPIRYEAGKPPYVESRLQDFFGQRTGPAILGGSLPLTLHLLAPNQRAVQVTTDLEGFWERHYPSIRRELMRRYPRHSWPEDGRTATPPPPPARR